MSQNIAKSMAYIMNELGSDFPQGSCLYKLTSGMEWTPEHLWTSNRPQKQASEQVDILISKNQVLQMLYLKHHVYTSS